MVTTNNALNRKSSMHIFLTGRSRGDAKHDFKSLNQIKEALQSNGFEKGLPDPPNPTGTLTNDDNWMSEIQNLAALVNSDSSTSSNTTFKQFITPFITDNRLNIKPDLRSADVLGSSYNIKQLENVKQNDGANTGIRFLNNLDIQQNAALVIDAASVSILKILKSGDKNNDINNIYYVMAPEITNDPAGKTSCKDINKLNDIEDSKITITPIIEMNSGERTYNYDINSLSSFNQFFSKYSFTLSELKTNKSLISRKSYHYNDITISDPKLLSPQITGSPKDEYSSPKDEYSVTINESKKQNNITSLLSSLNALVTKILTKKGGSKIDTFNMNREFQQKRAGDWLQVLLCKNLLSRKMAEFHSFATGVNTNSSITNDISETWFVTHDIIALTFALYSGVNCIFTNGGDVYSFKRPNVEGEFHFQTKITYMYNDKLNRIMPDEIDETERRFQEYNKNRTDQLTQMYLADSSTQVGFGTSITGYGLTSLIQIDVNNNNTFFPIPPTDNTDPNETINETIKQIFSLAYKYSYTASFFPDLSEAENRLPNLKQELRDTLIDATDLINSIGQATPTNQNVNDLRNINNKLKELIGEYISYYDTIDKYGELFQNKWQPYNLKYTVQSRNVTKLKKKYPQFQIELQPSYKLINKFSWKTVKFHMRTFLATFGRKDYKMDSCIYLYDMQHLPINIKNGITRLFALYDKKLNNNNNNIDALTVQGKKMHYVMKGFCQNVYMGIGGDKDNTMAFTSRSRNLQVDVEDVKENFTNYKKTISLVDSGWVGGLPTDEKITDDTCVEENQTFNYLTKGMVVENNYIYGNIIGNDANNNITTETQQKISNLCDALPAGNPTSEGIIDKVSGLLKYNAQRNQDCAKTVKDEDEKILAQGNSMRGGVNYTVDDLLLKSISNSVKQITYMQLGCFVGSNENNIKLIDKINKDYAMYHDISDPENKDDIFKKIDDIIEDHGPEERSTGVIIAQVLGAVSVVAVAAYTGYKYVYPDDDQCPNNEYGQCIMDPYGNYVGGTSTQSDTSSPNKTEFIDYITELHLKDNPEKITLMKETYNKLKDKLPFNLYFMGFHPLLPSYILLQGMYDLTCDHIEDSLDYELVVRYFNFIKKMNTEIRKVYETNVSETMDEAIVRQFAAYIIGEAINAMLIDLDLMRVNVNNKYYVEPSTEDSKLYIDKFLNMSKDQYFSIQLLGKNLSGEVIGSSEDINVNDNIGLLLQNPIITTFLRNVDIKSIFYSDEPIVMPESGDAFQEMVYIALKETGGQIIKGRRETTIPTNTTDVMSPLTPSPTSPCVSGKYKTTIKNGNIIKICDENAQIPVKDKQIRTMSDIRIDDKQSPDDISVESTLSSTSSRSRGGKKLKSKRRKINKKGNKTIDLKNRRSSLKRKSKKVLKKKIDRLTKKNRKV
jgi:hypothetical protein